MDRRPDAWLEQTADPVESELERVLEELVGRLDAAKAAAERVGARPVLGLREIELAPGRRDYLCAFDGPYFVCLDADLIPVHDVRTIHRAATVSLVWEQLEADIAPSRLADVAAAAARVLALTDAPGDMCAQIAATAEGATAMGAWRESPLRAVASLVQMDVLLALHDRAARAYAVFVRVSEPLVAEQDRLDASLAAALGEFERAAIAAGLGGRLADRISGAVASADEAAEEIVAAQLPMSGTGGGRGRQ
jgi:hypothetical protein